MNTRTLIVILSALPLGATPVVIQNVPDYTWTDGCVPTATADILGFYAGQSGYGNLFGSPEALVSQSVADPLIWELAADMHTDGQGNTQWVNYFPGLQQFVNVRGYTESSSGIVYGQIAPAWSLLTQEISAGDPMIFAVDPSGAGVTDHAVAVVGYDARSDGSLWYGAYTSWTGSPGVQWLPFRVDAPGIQWGVAGEVSVHMGSPDSGTGTATGSSAGTVAIPESKDEFLVLVLMVIFVLGSRLSLRSRLKHWMDWPPLHR
jgi:hypothetical protein